MSHSISKIWIHVIFSTKDREPLIKESFESELHQHIFNNFVNENNCYVKIINGIQDHLHILFLLNPNHSIKDVIHNIKGESSHWVNQNNFLKNKFAWQIGYGAFSVSESNVENVEKYIRNQKEHHRTTSYVKEYETFLLKYKLQ